MGCSEKCSIAITILLVSIVVETFGELIVVRHQPTDEGDTVKFTCITEEVDAALIWNYDNTTENVRVINNFTSSHLDGSNSPSTNGCEIGTLDSGSCFVEWRRDFRDWMTVNSMDDPPMSPVHDYRWEGFNEWTIGHSEVKYPRTINSRMVVFSAKGSGAVRIAFCEGKTVAGGPCTWFIIGRKSEGGSKILTCNGRKPDDRPTKGEHCKLINTDKQPDQKERLEKYEWRTFRIEWGVKENVVQVFKDVEGVPFLHGTVDTRSLPPYQVVTTGDPRTRVRYHDYKYIQAEGRNANTSTVNFQSEREELCFELMVGLCSGCGLKIHLVDASRDHIIDTKTIFGNGISTTNGLLTWQSQSVNLSIGTPRRGIRLYLKLETILNESQRGQAQWAMDKIRPCQPRGTLRSSTITVRKPKTTTNKYWPPIACQKLSHRGSDTIDLSKNFTRDLDTSHLEGMLKVWRESCESSCEGFGKGSLICNSTECSCDRGYQGENCTEECTLGSYGYNCSEKCGSCKDEKCNKETGHCEDGCVNVEFKSPLCQRDTLRFNKLWLIAIPIAAFILLAVFFIFLRCSKKRNSAPLQVSYGEVLSSRQENASMEYEEENPFYGTPICQSSTPPLNPQNREALSHVYAVPFVP